jgi:hypothetical protein
MADFQVVRLLQNPTDEPSPDRAACQHRAGVQQVATIYLNPNEYERLSEAGPRRMLGKR